MARDPMFPLSGPNVENGAITIDMMLNEPTRIDNYAAQLVERDLLSKVIFGNVTTTGGAITMGVTVVRFLLLRGSRGRGSRSFIGCKQPGGRQHGRTGGLSIISGIGGKRRCTQGKSS